MDTGILDRDIRYVKGVGEKRAQAFRKLKINKLRDLLTFYPRDYEDRRRIFKISELIAGEFCSFAAIVASPVKNSRIRNNLIISKVRAVDETGNINITFFNQPYVKDSLFQGERYLFYGKIQNEGFGFETASPEFTRLGDREPSGAIIPVYPLTAGLSQKAVISAVDAALDLSSGKITDCMPKAVRQKYKLSEFAFALENIHRPVSEQALELARRRLVFEELMALSTGLFLLKNRQAKKEGLKFEEFPEAEFFNNLPFKLTPAQYRAYRESVDDMTSGRLMNRLIQGDVGSGKTIVAAAAAYQAIRNGAQAALMAPTEVLATQHYSTLSPLFEKLGIKTEILLGKMNARKKKAAVSAIESGQAGFVIGTHAVITESVKFQNLGLVICDEQQRFGVNQRAALSAKGENPHVLVMSATPIPRTLGLILYGDLDLSIIDELPPGRQAVETYIVGENMRGRVEAFVRKQVELSHQVYIICPLIDENDSAETKSVMEYANTLREKVYGDLRVDILHGRMKSAEKDEVMRKFYAGETNILVSTTVIEVGVDNPNATLMVIENAERFGLSQLHQLRGRVGRGSSKSYCIMFCAGGEKSLERMKILSEENDGFKIAERDLEIRGPGNFFGSRQHGLPDLKLASLASDMKILKEAQSAAEELLRSDPELADEENRLFSEKIARMFSEEKGNIFN